MVYNNEYNRSLLKSALLRNESLDIFGVNCKQYSPNVYDDKLVKITARESSNLNSASSQFFIVQDDSLFLDGHYAAFGHVTAGMEVVDEIVKKVKPIDDNGTVEPKNQPIIDYIIVIE